MSPSLVFFFSLCNSLPPPSASPSSPMAVSHAAPLPHLSLLPADFALPPAPPLRFSVAFLGASPSPPPPPLAAAAAAAESRRRSTSDGSGRRFAEPVSLSLPLSLSAPSPPPPRQLTLVQTRCLLYSLVLSQKRPEERKAFFIFSSMGVFLLPPPPAHHFTFITPPPPASPPRLFNLDSSGDSL